MEQGISFNDRNNRDLHLNAQWNKSAMAIIGEYNRIQVLRLTIVKVYHFELPTGILSSPGPWLP